MLFRSNILALVGNVNSQYPPNKVGIWDDHQKQLIGEFSFRSNVLAVKLRKDRIVVVLEHRIFVYNFPGLKLVHQIETLSNPLGLCCVSQDTNTSVLVCPGVRQGQIHVEHFGLKVAKLITAHEYQISCITLTMDGLLLATSSTKGTLIRIFNTMDGACLQEVRRGLDRAEIYSIALSPTVQWLAVSSDKGTVHVFRLRVRVDVEDVEDKSFWHQGRPFSPLVSPSKGENPGSLLSFMKGVLPKYFSSEWSFAQFRIPEITQFFTAFGDSNTVLVLCLDGGFYRCSFDPVNGGPMLKQEYVNFLENV